MSRLVETIKVENGILMNIKFHNERMIRTVAYLFGITSYIELEKYISIPENLMRGVLKCRVEYEQRIEKIELIPYQPKIINSLKLIEDNKIEYAFKFTDRRRFAELAASCKEYEDILIIKNGMITDSSYANVVFRDLSGNWVTPSSYLLQGTKRASLLKRGIIHEDIITYRDLWKYTEVRVINAMLEIDDTDGIPVRNLV